MNKSMPKNLIEMDQFLKRHNLPKFTQEEIDNQNRPIFIKNIESTINKLPIESNRPRWVD